VVKSKRQLLVSHCAHWAAATSLTQCVEPKSKKRKTEQPEVVDDDEEEHLGEDDEEVESADLEDDNEEVGPESDNEVRIMTILSPECT